MGISTQIRPGSMPGLQTTENGSGSLTIAITGEIDLATRPALDAGFDQVLQRKPTQIIVDLSGVGFCGTTGLAALVDLGRRCAALGVDLEIKPSRVVRRALDVTGVGAQFHLAGRSADGPRPSSTGRSHSAARQS